MKLTKHFERSKDFFDEYKKFMKIMNRLLINSPVKTRVLWPLERVIKLATGSDNKTRCVRVKRSDSSEEVHSINLLYPLELSITPGFDDIVELPIEETSTTYF